MAKRYLEVYAERRAQETSAQPIVAGGLAKAAVAASLDAA